MRFEGDWNEMDGAGMDVLKASTLEDYRYRPTVFMTLRDIVSEGRVLHCI